MEKNYKLFNKISILDIFIGICIICILVFLYYISVPASSTASASSTTRQYIVEIKNIDEGLSSKLQVGEEIFDSIKGSSIGTVVNIEEKPYEVFSKNLENGTFILRQVDGLSSCYITIEAEITETDRSTNVGAYQLMVGTQVFVKTKNFAGNGHIIMLER